MTALTAVALGCGSKKSPEPSSSELSAGQVLERHGVTGRVIRVVDYGVRPGVRADEGDGDAWPMLRAIVTAADIVLIATPTRVGHMLSVAQRVLDAVRHATEAVARNAAHLAGLLRTATYPAYARETREA